MTRERGVGGHALPSFQVQLQLNHHNRVEVAAFADEMPSVFPQCVTR